MLISENTQNWINTDMTIHCLTQRIELQVQYIKLHHK